MRDSFRAPNPTGPMAALGPEAAGRVAPERSFEANACPWLSPTLAPQGLPGTLGRRRLPPTSGLLRPSSALVDFEEPVSPTLLAMNSCLLASRGAGEGARHRDDLPASR